MLVWCIGGVGVVCLEYLWCNEHWLRVWLLYFSFPVSYFFKGFRAPYNAHHWPYHNTLWCPHRVRNITTLATIFLPQWKYFCYLGCNISTPVEFISKWKYFCISAKYFYLHANIFTRVGIIMSYMRHCKHFIVLRPVKYYKVGHNIQIT